MSHDFRARHYTDQAGVIRADVVEDAALRFWAPQGLDHSIRRSTFEVQVAHCHNHARSEQDRMQANPLCASIDTVDWHIGARCRGEQDSLIREAAILAHHEGRAALLVRSYHPSGMLAANAVHGGDDLATHIIERADDQRRGLRTYADGIFAMLVACNQEAGDALQVAAWAIAERLDPASAYLWAAE